MSSEGSQTSLYTSPEWDEIAQKIALYVRLQEKTIVIDGRSGSRVAIVDIQIDKLQYRRTMVDTIQGIFRNQGKDATTLFNNILLYFDLNNIDYNSDDLMASVQRLISDALHNVDNQYHSDLTIANLLDELMRGNFWLSEDEKDILQTLKDRPRGFHYMKIHAKTDEETENSLASYQKIAREDPNIPDLVKYFEYKNSILAFYKPALGETDPKYASSLVNFALGPNPNYWMIEKNIKSVTQWLETRFIQSQDALDDSPQGWLQRFLGEKRYAPGNDNVWGRLKDFLTKHYNKTAVKELEALNAIRFDNEDALPNPLRLIEHDSLNNILEDPDDLTTQLSRAHGDLHLGNIIAHTSKRSSDMFDIIDFGDYLEEQSIFFDLLYLEFNILRNILPLDGQENKNNRKSVYNFLETYLFASPEEIAIKTILADKDHQHHIEACYNIIRIIRKSCENLLNLNNRTQDERKIFWITAMAVGLNYLRKRTLDSYELKMLSLMYAAFAYNNLLLLYEIELSKTTLPAATLQWIDLDEVQQTDLRGDYLIKELAEKQNQKIILILSPDLLADEDIVEDLIRELSERLRWHANVQQDDRRLTDVAYAIDLYREEGGDTNLRSAIQKIVTKVSQRNEIAEHIARIRSLLGNERVHVITYDWYDYLQDYNYTEQQSRIIHVLGHPSLPFSIDAKRAFDSSDNLLSPLSNIHAIHDKSCNVISQQDTATHVVFVGMPTFESSLCKTWFDLKRKNKKVSISCVVAESNLSTVKDQATRDIGIYYTKTPTVFLEELMLEIGSDEGIKLAPKELPRYIPNPVNYKTRINDIEMSENNYHIIGSPPGQGKTAFLRKLCEVTNPSGEAENSHESKKQYFIVDLASDNRLGGKVINIWHSIFDQLDGLTPPKYQDYETKLRNISDEAQRQRSFDAIWMNEFYNQIRKQGYSGKFFACFDSFRHAKPKVQSWLRFHENGLTIQDVVSNARELAHHARWEKFTASERSTPFGFADLIYYLQDRKWVENHGVNYKLVITQRGYRNMEHIATAWARNYASFTLHFLPDLSNEDIKKMIEDIVENDDTLYDNADRIKAGREDLKMQLQRADANLLARQIENYKNFCKFNMLAVTALIKQHLKEGFHLDDAEFPRSIEVKQKFYCTIYWEIWDDLDHKYIATNLPVPVSFEPANYCRPPSIFVENKAKDVVLQTLLCRRLDSEICAALFEKDTTSTASILTFLGSDSDGNQLFRDATPNDNPDLQEYKWYLVNESLHNFIQQYYIHFAPEVLGKIYMRLIYYLSKAITAKDNSGFIILGNSRNVLCLIYYLRQLYLNDISINAIENFIREFVETYGIDEPLLNDLNSVQQFQDRDGVIKRFFHYCVRQHFANQDESQFRRMLVELQSANEEIFPKLPMSLFRP